MRLNQRYSNQVGTTRYEFAESATHLQTVLLSAETQTTGSILIFVRLFATDEKMYNVEINAEMLLHVVYCLFFDNLKKKKIVLFGFIFQPRSYNSYVKKKVPRPVILCSLSHEKW
jgi:hypothetical protein